MRLLKSLQINTKSASRLNDTQEESPVLPQIKNKRNIKIERPGLPPLAGKPTRLPNFGEPRKSKVASLLNFFIGKT